MRELGTMNGNPVVDTTVAGGVSTNGNAALRARYRWAILVLSLTALSASVFLAWSTIRVGSVLGCGNEGFFDCSHVLQSRWSKFLGISVSLPAAALHLTLITLLIASAFRLPGWLRRHDDSGILICTLCAGAAAVWFLGLQVFVIGKFCQYCLVAHIAGLTACLVAMAGYGFRFERVAKPVVLAMAMVAVLAIGQVFGPVPETAVIESHQIVDSEMDDFDSFDMDIDELDSLDAPVEVTVDDRVSRREELVATSYETQSTQSSSVSGTPTPTPTPEEGMAPSGSPVPSPTPIPQRSSSEAERPVAQRPREIAYPGARTKLKVGQWPMVGASSAPVVVVELFDYTCTHCREMNRHINVARERFGDQVAFVLLPVPLNSNCNQTVTQNNPAHADSCEIANIALSVWRVDKAAFPSFHNWLCESENSRSAADARLYAEQLVDPVALRRELSGPIIGKFLARHVMIYEKAGKGILPKMLSEKITVSGKMSSAEALCDALRDNHGISPR